MILSEKVPVKIYKRNITYYKSLGYKISTIKTVIEVWVKDLSKGSSTKVLFSCDECGKEHWVAYKDVIKYNKPYCRTCAAKDAERIEKLRKANTGYKHTKETRKKMSEHSWQAKHTGKDNPLYNQELTFEQRYFGRNRNLQPENHQWKKKVKERDNNTCQKCGSTKHLCVHHLNSYKQFESQRYDVNNGTTLCVDCHKEFHKKFGRYTTKEQMNDFIIQWSCDQQPQTVPSS
jgi:hypothetical protein